MRCNEEMKLGFPMLVDGLDDAVNEAYAAWPERLYLVDVDGTIAYRGGPGPRGFIPGELDSALARGMAQWPRSAPTEPVQGPKRASPKELTREQKLELVRARRRAAKVEPEPEATPKGPPPRESPSPPVPRDRGD